jgi:hypothetical protein
VPETDQFVPEVPVSPVSVIVKVCPTPISGKENNKITKLILEKKEDTRLLFFINKDGIWLILSTV